MTCGSLNNGEKSTKSTVFHGVDKTPCLSASCDGQLVFVLPLLGFPSVPLALLCRNLSSRPKPDSYVPPHSSAPPTHSVGGIRAVLLDLLRAFSFILDTTLSPVLGPRSAFSCLITQ